MLKTTFYGHLEVISLFEISLNMGFTAEKHPIRCNKIRVPFPYRYLNVYNKILSLQAHEKNIFGRILLNLNINGSPNRRIETLIVEIQSEKEKCKNDGRAYRLWRPSRNCPGFKILQGN